jgi:hypothetical protein
MSEITQVKVSYKTITVKKGGDRWKIQTNTRENPDKLELETKNGRLVAYDGRNGRISAFVWLSSDEKADVRRKLIKARQNGHNVLVDA